jgi:hypothetical protein
MSASPTNPTNRPTTQTRDAAIISGIKKRFQNVPSVVLGGVTYTPAALAALFQSHINAANAVVTAKGQWKNAIAAYQTLTKTVSNAVTGLQEIVRQMFNNAPDAVADFGFTPKKTTKKSTVIKVVAAAKSRATREARNTLGKKEKLQIKGAVTAQSVGAAVTAAIESGASASVGHAPPAASAPAPTAMSLPVENAGNGTPPAGPTNGPHA